jgi:SAM-dependent methyltransferase
VLNGGHSNGRLSGIVSRFSRPTARPENGNRHVAVAPRPAAAVAAEPVHASKTFGNFLSLLFARPAAELVDLGPVIGANITFLGERVGCKIHVEDLYADVDRHARQGELDNLPEFLEGRFTLRDGSVDAVLCWDIFDYLAPAAANVLARELRRMLRPEGVLLGFFGARASDDPHYTKFLIEDETHLRHRHYPSACTRRWVLQNRDINHLFIGLELFDSLLLKSGVREILFRKPIIR